MSPFCVVEATESEFVNWCMVNITAELDKTVYKLGENATLSFRNDAANEKVFHYVINTQDFYVVRSKDLTNEESLEGVTEFTVPETPGKYNLFMLSRNEYGVYSSRFIDFRVE